MKTILHLIWYDVLRLRWYVLGWVIVQALYIGAGATALLRSGLLVGDDLSAWNAVMGVCMTLGLVQLAMPFLFGQLLVLADPLVGANAAWRTRPIARVRLLLAKIGAGLLLFVIVPAILAAPWWLWCGLTASQMANATLQILIHAGAVAIPAACVAALVDSLSRALIWGLLILPAVTAVAALLRMAGMIATDIAPMVLLGLGLGILAVLVAQYLARNSLVKAVVVAGAIAAAPIIWLTTTELRWPRASVEPPGANRLSTVFLGANEGRNGLSVDLHLDAPTDLAYRATSGVVTWRWSKVTWHAPAEGMYGSNISPQLIGIDEPQPDPETVAWQNAERARIRQLGRAARIPRERTNSVPYFNVPAGVLTRIEHDAPAAELEIDFSLFRPARLGVYPLSDSSWHATHGVGWRIERTAKPGEFLFHEAVFDPHLFPNAGETAEVWFYFVDAKSQLLGDLWTRGWWTNRYWRGVGMPIFSVRPALNRGEVTQRPVVRRGKWIAGQVFPPDTTEVVVAALEPLGWTRRKIAVGAFHVER